MGTKSSKSKRSFNKKTLGFEPIINKKVVNPIPISGMFEKGFQVDPNNELPYILQKMSETKSKKGSAVDTRANLGGLGKTTPSDLISRDPTPSERASTQQIKQMKDAVAMAKKAYQKQGAANNTITSDF